MDICQGTVSHIEGILPKSFSFINQFYASKCYLIHQLKDFRLTEIGEERKNGLGEGEGLSENMSMCYICKASYL